MNTSGGRPAMFCNGDHDAFQKEVTKASKSILVQGTSSAVLKTALRDGCDLEGTIVFDIVRSPWGFYGHKCHALSSPSHGLSSRLFCAALKQMRNFSRQGGWRNRVHTCASSCLRAFALGASQPKDMSDVPVVEHVCGFNDAAAQECHVPSSSMVRASVEAAHSMSALESEFQHRRTHSTLRQKRWLASLRVQRK